MIAFRRAWRGFARNLGFSLLCVLTLAVAIGANAAIFSIVDGVLLSPLPFPEPERLVGLWHVAPGLSLESVDQSEATYRLYRDHSGAFLDLAAYRDGEASLSGAGAPWRLRSAEVTSSLFRVLRTSPGRGRAFLTQEELPGAEPVVILSERLWQKSFAADPAVLGKMVRIDEVPHRVIGVMPASFFFPNPETDLWLPLQLHRARTPMGHFGLSGIARLRAGTSIAAAQAELNRLLSHLVQAFPGDPAAPILARAGFAARVHRLRDDVVGDAGKTLWVLFGAVGFILLVACANVANLLLVRGERRLHDTAIRAALGARRRSFAGAALAETLLLGAAAGALGLAAAQAGILALRKWGPVNLPRLHEISVDARVLGFTAAVTFAVSALFALVPAWQFDLGRLGHVLRGGGNAARLAPARRRVQQLLVVAQVAFALVVVTGSCLLARSFLRLSRVDPGFAAPSALTLTLALPAAGYPTDAAAARFFEEALARVRAVPGVAAAGVTSALPLADESTGRTTTIEGLPSSEKATLPVIELAFVSEGYFSALGIPLLQGRTLDRLDTERRTGAVVVDETLAHRFWPRGALGRHLRPGGLGKGPDPWYTVVGVVGAVRNRRLAEKPAGLAYYALLAKDVGEWTPREASLVVRTRVAPASLVPALRRAIATLDPSLPLARVRTMRQVVRQSQASMTFASLMLLIAAAVTLALGAVGIFGFISFMAQQRIPEIGVRIAVGARAGDILRLVLREGLATGVPGVAAGLVGAAGLTRWIGSLLYEVSPFDAVTFAVAPLLLVAVVLLAALVPAWRAARTDPILALGGPAALLTPLPRSARRLRSLRARKDR